MFLININENQLLKKKYRIEMFTSFLSTLVFETPSTSFCSFSVSSFSFSSFSFSHLSFPILMASLASRAISLASLMPWSISSRMLAVSRTEWMREIRTGIICAVCTTLTSSTVRTFRILRMFCIADAGAGKGSGNVNGTHTEDWSPDVEASDEKRFATLLRRTRRFNHILLRLTPADLMILIAVLISCSHN